ncbi:DUF4060 family protein [Salmonella enterica]|nr:DUF4060 family protein [Salmonella enterica]EKH2044104.1 DUF4060 family protein [Salmonella enterica]EKI8502521.1 DUF4060 family protein [Salmonella enterica]EKI9850838.1 DUF4060 family protein [Salmonella enterica]
MKLINRSKQSPVDRRLAARHESFDDYGRQKHITHYIVVEQTLEVAVLSLTSVLTETPHSTLQR